MSRLSPPRLRALVVFGAGPGMDCVRGGGGVGLENLNSVKLVLRWGVAVPGSVGERVPPLPKKFTLRNSGNQFRSCSSREGPSGWRAQAGVDLTDLATRSERELGGPSSPQSSFCLFPLAEEHKISSSRNQILCGYVVWSLLNNGKEWQRVVCSNREREDRWASAGGDERGAPGYVELD